MKKQTVLLSVLLLVLLTLPFAGVLGQERGPLQLNPGPAQVAPEPDYIVPAENANNMITFEWQTLPEPTTIWYNLWVGKGTTAFFNKWYNMEAAPGNSAYIEKVCDIDCSDPEANVIGLRTTAQITGNGAFEWKVRAWETHIDPDNFTEYTGPRTFTIPFNVTGMTTNSAADHRGDPTFTWNHDPRAEWYQLVVGVPTTPFKTLHNVWYQAISAELPCVTDEFENTTCSVRPGMELENLPNATYPNNSEYHWYVRAWGQVQGFGPFNTIAQSFTLSLSPPDGGQFNSEFFDVFADDNINDIDQPVFVFNDIPGAAWYNLVVFKANNQLIHNGWYRRTTVCEDEEGTVICEAFPTSYNIPEIYLMNSAFKSYGDYKWHVRAWGPGGFSTGGTSVTLGTTLTPGFSPQRTLLVNFPALSSGQSPTQVYPLTLHPAVSNANLRFEWQPLTGGTWYNLQIYNNQGTLVFDNWRHFSEPGVDCLENCHWPNPTSLAKGRYWWRIMSWGPAGAASGWSEYNRFDLN